MWLRWVFLSMFVAGTMTVNCADEDRTFSNGGAGGEGSPIDGAINSTTSWSTAGPSSSAASAATTGGGGSSPTCTDGLKNGNETGIDCGGSCPPCCQPQQYTLTTGQGSGNVTVCCKSGDTLMAVVDCAVGMNHGVNAQGNCGVGYEGAMNNGTSCAEITCKTPCP